MRTLTMLFFAIAMMISTVMAQKVIPIQEVNNSIYVPISMGDYQQNLNASLMLLNNPGRLLKSTPTIKLDSIVISERTSESAPWSRYNKQVFKYDDYQRLVEISSTKGLYSRSFWPEKAVFSYNESGKVDSIYLYSNIPDYPESCTLFNFTYNDMGRMLTAYSYYFYEGNWEINIGKNFSYTPDGNISEIFVEENWWSYWTSLHNYTYDLEGKLIRYQEGSVYQMLATYDYDSEGNLIEENYQDWYQKRKQNYYYNSDGSRIKSERVYWIKPTQNSNLDLCERSSEEYEYLDLNSSDLVDLHLSLLNQSNELDEVEFCPEELISTVYSQNSFYCETSSLPGLKKSEFYYSSITFDPKSYTEINDRQNSEFAVFPNPATDQIVFTWKTGYNQLNLKIFQLTGSCVTDMEISSNESINLEKLPRGIYIFKLIGNKRILKTGKLVIQ